MQSTVKLHSIFILKHGHSDEPDKGQCQLVFSWLRQVKVGKSFDYNTSTCEKVIVNYTLI